MNTINSVAVRRTTFLLSLLFLPSALNVRPASAQEGLGMQAPQTIIGQPHQEILFREYPTLSMPSLEPSPFRVKPLYEPTKPPRLQAEVAFTENSPSPQQTLSHLLEVAEARDEQRDLLANKAKFHGKKWTRMVSRSKGMLQYATSYQGFESSSEAADVILEEKLKLKSGSAVEFVRQKKMDAMHLQMVCALMEIATGLGLTDEGKKQQAVSLGMKEITPLVGEEEAAKCLQAMEGWSKQVKVSEESFSRDPWDVLSLRQKSTEMLASSLKDDDVVKSIETRLHKFNRHSKLSGATAKFVNTTLSLVAFSPTMASPAAQAAQWVYVACTGGPEEKKLLKEVYLDRCFESRFERLSQESMLTISNYNNAIMTKNPVLYSCTQAFIDGLTKPEIGAALTSAAASGEQLSARKTFGQRI